MGCDNYHIVRFIRYIDKRPRFITASQLHKTVAISSKFNLAFFKVLFSKFLRICIRRFHHPFYQTADGELQCHSICSNAQFQAIFF